MTKLGTIMEGFVERARQGRTVPTSRGPVQINHTGQANPIIPVDRWQCVDKKSLRKLFRFKTTEQRNQFIFQLLQFEELVQHHADLIVSKDTVDLCVWTKDMGTVTDLDKDYAKQADVIFKDVAYCPVHEFK